MRLTDVGRRVHDDEVARRRLLALLGADGLVPGVAPTSETAATSGRPAPAAPSPVESTAGSDLSLPGAAPAAPQDGEAIAGDTSASSVLRPSSGDPGPRPAAVGGGSSPWVKWSFSWADRMDVGPPGARALVAVGIVASLVAVCFVWKSRPRPEPVPVAGVRPSVAAPVAVSSPRPSIVVHVMGKVRRPGVVTLPSGARVIDAIKAAGGLRPGAGTGQLNLARHVIDGEQIVVGVRGGPAPQMPVPPGGAGGPAAGGVPGTQLDLNTATAEQLDGLPGVGPVLAQRIVAYRDQHGGFRSVDQLQEVTGIGESKFADIKDLVRV